MSTAKRDYYDVLGVSRSATEDEIKRAYRQLVLRYHPDVNKTAEAEERFRELVEAAEVLHDPQKRQAYDRFVHNGPRSPFGSGGPGGDTDPFRYGFDTGWRAWQLSWQQRVEAGRERGRLAEQYYNQGRAYAAKVDRAITGLQPGPPAHSKLCRRLQQPRTCLRRARASTIGLFEPTITLSGSTRTSRSPTTTGDLPTGAKASTGEPRVISVRH